nr:MAG TPA: Large polyvalent protein associated domain 29 [Caudoviricetes sp.]
MTTKNVPLNVIADNLSKVFTDKAQSAQYYSDNEQYICLCGWCGPMSPISRPAYVKTFGKATTEAAEVAARELIANKEAVRQRTKYAEHAKEADRLEGVPAVGGFFWTDNSGLKCDGGRGLFEELHALNYYTDAQNTPARLCCVGEIIRVSEEDFSRPALADELVQANTLQGFSRSEDVDDSEDMTAIYNDPEKLATFYTVGALVVSPSGKYYLIDSEGYNYARYIYVPIEWPELLADEVASVKAEEDARKAEEERQEAEAKAQRLAQYRARCAKWSHLMQDVRPLEADPKTTSRQLMNARKANILAMCRAAFPGVKFSLKVRHGWGADFELSWTDGPTVEEFNEKTDFALFCRCRDTFDGWDDSTGVDYAEFADFARLTMGSNGGDIKLERVMSDEARAELLAQIFAVVPAANNRNKYGYTEAYTYNNKESEAVAAALGVAVLQIFANGYAENAETIARRAWDAHSYTKITTPEPTDPKLGKAQAADTDTTDEAPAEGLQLVETAEGVAVVGDSRTTYRNRKQIKAHGAKWNKTAQQWQASDAEAVARLREWFGVSDTPTAEEGDTANESTPQEDYTHTTESTPIDQIVDTLADVQQEDTPTASAPLLYEACEIMATAPTDTAESDSAEPTTADSRKNGKTFSILGVRYNAPASLRENVRDWFAHNAPTADRDAIPADADFRSVNAALSVSPAASLPRWCSSLDYLTRLLILYGAAVCAAPASAGHLSVPKKLVMVGMMQESARR